MKGKFEHCHQFTDKGKQNYDQINWGSKKPEGKKPMEKINQSKEEKK